MFDASENISRNILKNQSVTRQIARKIPVGIACSKLTIETLEKDVKYVQNQQ